MADIDLLNTEFANLYRRAPAAADEANLVRLVPPPVPQDIDMATIATATQALVRQTVGVAEVGVLAYGFFTGVTLRQSGLDYLLSPNGPDPDNLQSAFYAGYSTQNRYIDFAVNLGKNGEGAAAFQAGYGALTLQQTADKAYAAIFGSAATEPSDLLTAAVPNGQGGTYTRADYFASYGGDGANGLGTKAALVGWLLAVAAETGLGPYAQAATAYLQDLAPDGQAQFGVNLLAAYGAGGDYAPGGRLDPGLPGVTLALAHDQSVLPYLYNGPGGPAYPTPPAYSTTGNDVVTSTTGQDAGVGWNLQSGNDVVTVTGGFASGVISEAGTGNDRITLSDFNGTVQLGAGYDTVTLGGFTSATAAGGAPQIAGFVPGRDQLVFADAVGPGRVSPIDVRAATSLQAALTLVAGETAAGANTVFEYGGSTYVFHQNADPTVNQGAAAGSDGLIQLVGVTGATLDAHDGRAYDIHFGG